jgi:hypothetical protein
MSTNSNQIVFDRNYITSHEITQMLGISRAGFLYGRRSKKISAEPIIVNNGRLLVWERTPLILAELRIWKESIDSRKVAA